VIGRGRGGGGGDGDANGDGDVGSLNTGNGGRREGDCEWMLDWNWTYSAANLSRVSGQGALFLLLGDKKSVVGGL
jgi:hypothetical protein